MSKPTPYTVTQLSNRLVSNLMKLSDNDYAYVAGYLQTSLTQVAIHGIDELVSIVDYNNQRVEAFEYNKRTDARRAAFENGEYAN
jgi:hypothetical protein